MKRRLSIFLLLTGIIIGCNQETRPLNQGKQTSWENELAGQLDLLGHRNWILVVDKAFPEQSADAIRTIYTDNEMLPVLTRVLSMMDTSTHVVPVIYRDSELDFLSEGEVPGINSFREESLRLLNGRDVLSIPHEEVFNMLDETASLFRILVLKTSGTLPYTSFFLRLDCAYWNPEQEKQLREKMDSGK
jgi:L-fucose mutarotase/ribose pyranase (RbsD/FucU family)